MIVMDRENLFAKGWSHALSTTDDLAELEAFRIGVGAPRAAFHFGRSGRPHLDLRDEPRTRALADPTVRVFDRSRDLVAFLRAPAADR